MKHQANKISLNIPFISNLSDYNEKKLLRAINLLIHGAVAFCLLFLINMGAIDTYSLAIVYTSIIFPVALARFFSKKITKKIEGNHYLMTALRIHCAVFTIIILPY